MKKLLTTTLLIVLALPCMLIFSAGIICIEVEECMKGLKRI